MTVGVGWADAHLVMPLMQQSRHEEAEQAGRAAVQILEPLGDSEELADALHRLGWFLWRRGREPEAEPLLRRAIDIADRRGRKGRARRGDADARGLPDSLDAFAEAQQLMEEAFLLAKEAGDNVNLMRAYNNMAATRARRRARWPPPRCCARDSSWRCGRERSRTAVGSRAASATSVQLLGRLEESRGAADGSRSALLNAWATSR